MDRWIRRSAVPTLQILSTLSDPVLLPIRFSVFALLRRPGFGNFDRMHKMDRMDSTLGNSYSANSVRPSLSLSRCPPAARSRNFCNVVTFLTPLTFSGVSPVAAVLLESGSLVPYCDAKWKSFLVSFNHRPAAISSSACAGPENRSRRRPPDGKLICPIRDPQFLPLPSSHLRTLRLANCLTLI
jgi:hypothetical protein